MIKNSKTKKIYLFTLIFLSLILAAALPLIFKSDFLLSILCQIGIMIIFALSYNMLLGQTGLLSFGHAVYYGFGAFATIHTLNFISKSSIFPLPILPLVGGICGLLIAVILGYISTKKAGTTFTMISLGIAEMVNSCSLMFPGFFGGEGGISGNRVIDNTGVFGITYGPQIQFYSLILFWVIICSFLMYGIAQTPLGKMANAVRDNPERAEFVGYNPQRVRFLMILLSSFFAGIAGGLTALNYEIVTAETVGANTSAVVLLMAFVGGIGSFYGPIIGAILITFMQIFIGGISKAWLFYLGLLFILMVLFVPGGLASVINVQLLLWERNQFFKLLPRYVLSFIPLMVALSGIVSIIEMSYLLLSGDAHSGENIWGIYGIKFSVTTISPWIFSCVSIFIGFIGFKFFWRRFVSPAWLAAQKSGAL